MSALGWVVILFVLGLWAFFVVLGAMTPGETLPVTVVVAVLFALYLLHAWRGRGADDAERQRVESRFRERRGF